jgi:hypothetical protein
VDRGCDVVAKDIAEGIRDLCSNVSEWTSTPWQEGNSDNYYAAGACFRDTDYNFSIIRPFPPGTPRDDIGFRCAIGAAEVRAAIEAGAGSNITTTSPTPAMGSK